MTDITTAAEAVSALREQLAALDKAYSSGHHGRWSAARRSGLVDECLRIVFRESGAPADVALCAVGGYGRGELAPRSDVDLLLLHDGRGDMRALAERILYPLWDAGLTLGHSVRTPAECVAGAGERLEIATSLLDLRAVAGSETLAEQTQAQVRSAVAADVPRFVSQLIADRERRAARYGSVSHLLEPSLKEGVGGLRDENVLHWLALVRTSDGGVTGLVPPGILRSREANGATDAEEFLFRARSAVHLETGRTANRLRREDQPEIARALGFTDEPGLSAVDALMRALFEHARQLEHATGAALGRLGAGPGDAATTSAVGRQPETPADVLSAFADAAERAEEVAPAILDAIDTLRLPAEIEWTPEVRDAFSRLVRSGEAAVGALEALDRIDLLERFLPAWRAVRCRPQRDPFHRYPVDVHLLETMRGVYRLLDAPPEDDPVAVGAVSQIGDREPLLIAALLHDAGKVGEGDHVEIGATVAAETTARMGLGETDAELVEFLVANHLQLSDTATRRDLQDAELVAELAARIATPERLAALYVLTVADAGATGPHAWTPWRQTLIRELVGKVQRVLERGIDPKEEERAAAWERELRARLDPDVEVEAFLERMPRSYRLAVPAELAATHPALLSPDVGAQEVRTAAIRGSREGTWSLTVVASDRPGLLSWIAGALSLAGLSILSAQVYTTNDDVAVDVFEVVGAFDPDVGEERWRRFRSTLRKVLEGRLSLEHRVEEQRANYPPPRDDIALEVRVDNDASDFYTVIEVGAPDRIGLLFEITRTFAELELDVHLAKVATYGERVIDAFYVRDALGRKLEHPARAGELARALKGRIGRPTTA